MNLKSYSDYLNNFFSFYEKFLLVDATVSIIAVGRSRDILGDFLLYFVSIVDKKDEQKISFYEEHIELLLEQYLVNNIQYIVTCNENNKSSGYTQITSRINVELNNSLKAFVKASKLYELHRKKLSQPEIIELYKKNSFDYYLTAFGSETQDEFKAVLDTYTTSKQVNGVRLLKQSLMEFNNAISHLYSAWKKSSVDNNIERAQHHLNRGALDFYKSIIKELSMLNKIDDSIFQSIKQIRCSEYSTIGGERCQGIVKPQSLYDKYHELCSKIIES